MSAILGFCLVFAVGAAGFLLFRLIKIPNPALLGSMFATGALNVAGYYPPLVTWPVSFAANCMIGIMIGRQIDRNILRRVRALLRPVAVQTAGILALSLVCGYTMSFLSAGSGVSLKTALISGAAGGINEMIIFGMSADANVAVIAFVQLFRVVTFLVLIPYLSMLGEKIGRKRQDPMPIGGSDKKIAAFSALDYVPLAAFALLGSALGTALRVPTGAMLGAMLAGGIFSIAIDKKYRYDTRIRFVAQIGLGLALGQRMSPEIVSQLGTTFIPAIAVTAIMLVGSTLLAFLLHKTTGWDIVTCLLCSAPAGLSQITVFAEEIGADSLTASVFHTVRIIGIVSLYPWIIMPLAG